MKRILDPRTMTWRFPDGSGVITEEERMDLELKREKWRMRNFEGKVDVDEMIKDLEGK